MYFDIYYKSLKKCVLKLSYLKNSSLVLMSNILD